VYHDLLRFSMLQCFWGEVGAGRRPLFPGMRPFSSTSSVQFSSDYTLSKMSFLTELYMVILITNTVIMMKTAGEGYLRP